MKEIRGEAKEEERGEAQEGEKGGGSIQEGRMRGEGSKRGKEGRTSELMSSIPSGSPASTSVPAL